MVIKIISLPQIVAHVPTAIIYRLLQIIVITLSCVFLFKWNLYAYFDTPNGDGNIWVKETSEYATIINTQNNYSDLSYCSSADYSYNYSSDWVYEQPECRAMPVYEIVRKINGAVYIMTQFQETIEAGWPCSQTNTTNGTTCDGSLFDSAHAGQPTLTSRASGQCVCVSSCALHPADAAPDPLSPLFLPTARHTVLALPRLCLALSVRRARLPPRRTKTIFPVGVEKLAVMFEHAFWATKGFSNVASWGSLSWLRNGDYKPPRGSSSSRPCWATKVPIPPVIPTI